MPNCAIFGCKTSSSNAKERRLKLFSFPKHIETRLKWISACKKPYKFNENNARICSKHFPEEAFEKPLIQRMLNYSPTNSRKLKLDAFPTKYLPPFAESEVKIEILCNEIENIPMDEAETTTTETDPLELDATTNANDDGTKNDSTSALERPSSSSDDDSKKISKDARIAYETLMSTYQKFFTENEELKIKNKALKIECDKHKKLYEKRLQENIKLRQRNRALFNETSKLKNRLKKYEQNSGSEPVTDVMPCATVLATVCREVKSEKADVKYAKKK
ncbi:uncharacterized protein LOC135835222 [Planococcus citri]|uniref:uncharacterized protein LOC135835222 n=1 Tax=Planococcus citri TaxID=170843 RepID=UPI0031F90C14